MMTLGQDALSMLNGDDSIDVLADLCAHWKRHRANNYTPTTVRAGILLVCKEIAARDATKIEEHLRRIDDALADHTGRIQSANRQITEVREQVLANMRAETARAKRGKS